MTDVRDGTPQATAPQLRWSSVKTCPRLATYEATGAPHRDLTRVEENRLQRGREVGQAYVIRLAQSNNWKIHVASGRDFMLAYPEWRADGPEDADAIAEMQVRWQLGVGHPDLFVKETDTVLEVLSSANTTGDYIQSKLLQARGYAEGLDATSICVAIVDPWTLDEDRVIVASSSPKWEALTEEMHARVLQVQRWNETGEVPPRVCRKPQESWGRFCTFGGHCFDDAPEWTPDVAGELQSEEAQQLAIRLAHVKAQRREIAAGDKTLEREQKDIQAGLELIVPGGDWQVGGYLVKRSERAGRRSFDFDRAELDGRFPAELLGEFTKTGAPFDVWSVEKTGPVLALPDDDEGVPF